jgi:uncharacterized membrane protein YedE/YeeE
VNVAIALACGVLFSLGLGVSGMLQPTRVIGFLDFFGAWDPTLVFVMCGAIPVHLVAWYFARGRSTLCGTEVPAKANHSLDARLVAGATLFGVGWALTGVCPGPAVTNLAAPSMFTLTAMASILAGVVLSYFVPARAN